jgi:hypothetical protein
MPNIHFGDVEVFDGQEFQQFALGSVSSLSCSVYKNVNRGDPICGNISIDTGFVVLTQNSNFLDLFAVFAAGHRIVGVHQNVILFCFFNILIIYAFV